MNWIIPLFMLLNSLVSNDSGYYINFESTYVTSIQYSFIEEKDCEYYYSFQQACYFQGFRFREDGTITYGERGRKHSTAVNGKIYTLCVCGDTLPNGWSDYYLVFKGKNARITIIK